MYIKVQHVHKCDQNVICSESVKLALQLEGPFHADEY